MAKFTVPNFSGEVERSAFAKLGDDARTARTTAKNIKGILMVVPLGARYPYNNLADYNSVTETAISRPGTVILELGFRLRSDNSDPRLFG